jgi:hypothetical protein
MSELSLDFGEEVNKIFVEFTLCPFNVQQI